MAGTPISLLATGSDVDIAATTPGVDNFYTTASITPTANTLVLAVVHMAAATAPAPMVTLTGAGLTWVEHVAIGWWVGHARRITVFRAVGTNPTSGAITITSDRSATGMHCLICEIPGVDISGSNGENAIIQAVADTGSSRTMAAFQDPVNNLAFGTFGSVTNGAAVPGDGFTTIGLRNNGSPNRNTITEYAHGEKLIINATNLNTSAGIGLEIKSAPLTSTAVLRRREGY